MVGGRYIRHLWRQGGGESAAVAALTARFNLVVDWVTWEVVRRATARERAEAIQLFVRVARYCLACQALNAVFAVMGGLSAPPVARLKASWARVAGAPAGPVVLPHLNCNVL